MGIKCTVFGHRFGPVDVERTREEEGSEVVITVREAETCTRCGHERTVSENKEVTTTEPEPGGTATDEPTTVTADRSPDLADVADVADEPTPHSGPADGADDAEIIEEQPEESIVQEAEPTTASPESESVETTAGTETEEDAIGDDAVILEETPDREPGAWPEEPDDPDPEWEPSTDPVRSDPDLERPSEAVTVPEGTFHCPECGFSTPVEASSLREGDFCPECHTGSLAHEAGD